MQYNPDHYWSSHYDKGIDYGLIPSSMVTRIVTMVDSGLPKECLDVGCGTGQLTRELYHRGYTCTGLDISTSAIRIAKSNTIFSDKLIYQRADVENLEEVTLTPPYSLITCKLVFAFITDKEKLLGNIHKLLADNGLFVIITPTNVEEQPAISVDFNTTKEQLEAYFSNVNDFPGRGVTYFICHK